MSFVGGKLKLKGGDDLKAAGGVKKKKKAHTSDSTALTTAGSGEVPTPGQPTRDGYALDPSKLPKKTEAELRYEDKRRKLEEVQLKKAASKSYREHVNKFNEHLAKLSEHHDIPKVGPG